MSYDKSKEQESRKEWEAKIIVHAWKDQNFKRQLLSNPEQALKEFGCPYPKNCHFKVIEEKENEYTLVLPRSPAGSANLNEKQLFTIAGGSYNCNTASGPNCEGSSVSCFKG
jgi:hypothetical protein